MLREFVTLRCRFIFVNQGILYKCTQMPQFPFIPSFDFLNHNGNPLCLRLPVYLPVHLSLFLVCTPPFFRRLISKCHRREESASEISVHNVTELPRGVFFIDPSVSLLSSFLCHMCTSWSHSTHNRNTYQEHSGSM